MRYKITIFDRGVTFTAGRAQVCSPLQRVRDRTELACYTPSSARKSASMCSPTNINELPASDTWLFHRSPHNVAQGVPHQSVVPPCMIRLVVLPSNAAILILEVWETSKMRICFKPLENMAIAASNDWPVYPCTMKWYTTKRMMDKSAERIGRKDEKQKHRRVDPHRALNEIWPLSVQLFALSGKYDVQSRLQRSIETIFRP